MSRSTTVMHQDFEIQLKRQMEWRILILMAFFFGAVGCGAFLVSAFYRYTFGIALSLLIIIFLMGVPHLIYLGQPLRFWRIFANRTAIKTSWIARGMWSWVVFLVFGVLYLALSSSWFFWLPWYGNGTAGTVLLVIAAIAAVFGMLYPAFAMGQSPAIAFWNNPILPVLFILYGLIDGIDVTLVSRMASGSSFIGDARFLEQIEILLLALAAVSIWAYLGLMSASKAGAREAVHILTRGELAFIFWGIVITAGLVLPLGVALYGYFVGTPVGISGATAVLGLAGALSFKHAVLKAGVYSPQI